MKTKILPLIILSILFTGTVFAQEADLPDAGLLPDSPFYFLERIAEATRTFFTFGDIKKAERHALLAAERLAEAQAVAEKDKPELVEKTLARYEMQLEKALSRIEKAKNEGKNTKEVANIISEATQKHITVLEKVLEKVPEQAKPTIEQAITVSSRGSERALEAVSSGQGFSPRAFCIEQGGTQEMCEMMPSKNFGSFKEIRDFCTEQGGSAEICQTLEDKCRELGITKADSCFRVLSISSVTTYHTTAPTAVPASTLLEQEMQQNGIQTKAEKAPSQAE
ncbi:hypothetical protein KJ751_03300 [Patescibacteria group bacterium]|nr:hypothetical protein [Patescibacteria group bacterium]